MKRLLLIMLLTGSIAQAETYMWTDGEGTVHFSGSRGEIPEHYRKSAETIDVDAVPGGTGDGRNLPAGRPAVPGPGNRDQTMPASQVEGLKEQMLKDDAIMGLVGAMQNDPEIRALLNDPAVLGAVRSGDIGTLLNNPAFLKLLNNPQVREIENRLGASGGSTR